MENEAKTRRELIDGHLLEAGWDVKDRSRVEVEFDITLDNAVSETPAPYLGRKGTLYYAKFGVRKGAFCAKISIFDHQNHAQSLAFNP
jgi:hypothetical protein